jgi:hypothetical protein
MVDQRPEYAIRGVIQHAAGHVKREVMVKGRIGPEHLDVIEYLFRRGQRHVH